MENITNSSSQFDITLHLIVIFPSLINIAVLLILSCQMYFAIEVAHPIYSVLFFNLLITALSFLIDVSVFPFVKGFKYNTLVIGNNSMCWIFQCCCWCVLSVLRYIYLVHTEWVHTSFPDHRMLSAVAILAILLTFVFCFGNMIGTVMHFGWPQVRVFEMMQRQKVICISTFFLNYIGLIFLSCIFYFLILRRKGRAGVNSVSISQGKLIYL